MLNIRKTTRQLKSKHVPICKVMPCRLNFQASLRVVTSAFEALPELRLCCFSQRLESLGTSTKLTHCQIHHDQFCADLYGYTWCIWADFIMVELRNENCEELWLSETTEPQTKSTSHIERKRLSPEVKRIFEAGPSAQPNCHAWTSTTWDFDQGCPAVPAMKNLLHHNSQPSQASCKSCSIKRNTSRKVITPAWTPGTPWHPGQHPGQHPGRCPKSSQPWSCREVRTPIACQPCQLSGDKQWIKWIKTDITQNSLR